MEHINNIEDIYKLSPMQQGMLFHTLYAPDSEVYREQTSCSLKGNLNVSAFQQAWGQVVHRHPILRTAFYREHRLTLNTLLVQGAWALLLSHYSGEESELPSSDISGDMEEIAV